MTILTLMLSVLSGVVGRAEAGTDCGERSLTATSLKGAVLETMDAAGYTYLRVDVGTTGTWAAVKLAKVPVGACVTLRGPQRMVDFKSPTLGRTFPEIYFAVLAPDTPTGQLAQAHASAPSELPLRGEVIAPATGPGAHTVADVLSQRKALAGQVVVVRARVTKRADGIQGKSWLHVADGTSGPEGSDVLVTTPISTKAGIGDLVLVRGSVQIDLDLGYGYRYPVVIGDASVETLD